MCLKVHLHIYVSSHRFFRQNHICSDSCFFYRPSLTLNKNLNFVWRCHKIQIFISSNDSIDEKNWSNNLMEKTALCDNADILIMNLLLCLMSLNSHSPPITSNTLLSHMETFWAACFKPGWNKYTYLWNKI
jgi:hypothetical protein